MNGPKVVFAALATVATMATAQAQLRIEPMPGGATSTVPATPPITVSPAGPQTMQLPATLVERARNNSKAFAVDVALAGMNDLQEMIADKGSSCADLGSIYTSQQGIIQNQRTISHLPALRDILEAEIIKAKVPEATAKTKTLLAERCPGTKLE